MPPTMTPVDIPIDLLQAFCDKARPEDPSAKLCQPVHIGPWTYFLDRYAGVRLPRFDGAEEFSDAYLREAIVRVFAPLDTEETFPVVEIPNAPTYIPKPEKCDKCGGTGKTAKCYACDGTGEISIDHRWEDKTGRSRLTIYDVSCDDCGGRGHTKGGDEACDWCKGTGVQDPEYPELVQVAQTAISWKLVQKFLALPGAKLHPRPFSATCVFRGDGWGGIVMPVRAPGVES